MSLQGAAGGGYSTGLNKWIPNHAHKIHVSFFSMDSTSVRSEDLSPKPNNVQVSEYKKGVYKKRQPKYPFSRLLDFLQVKDYPFGEPHTMSYFVPHVTEVRVE